MLQCSYTSVCCECLCVWLLWDSERNRQQKREEGEEEVEEEEEEEEEKERKRKRAVGEQRIGKLKLHDEYIGAWNPNRER